MRKIIVCNFVTLDGYYESKDKTLEPLFEYYPEEYTGDQHFDYYNTERLRASDTLLLSGRTSFLGNKDYWTRVLPNDPKATPIRLEFAELIQQVEKIVVSDKITPEELAPGIIPALSDWPMPTGRLPLSNSNPVEISSSF